MTIPTLPQNESSPDARLAALASSRASVDFDRSRPGFVFPSDVPAGQGMSFEWAAKVEMLAVATELADVSGALAIAADQNAPTADRLKSAAGLLQHWLAYRPDRPPTPFRPSPWMARAPLTMAEQSMLMGDLPRTEAMTRWDEDFFFAWQRIASDETALLELVTQDTAVELLKRVPLDAKTFAKVRAGDDLQRAIAEHRLMVCDLRILHDVPAGYSNEWRRWLPAPVAIFALSPDRKALWPVAIQCGPEHSEQNPVLTPLDGQAWRMARACYNGAESTYHRVVEHGALCQLVMGAIAVAMIRCLAPTHPIRVLLEPHFEMTVGIARATADLYVPGGRTSQLQSISVDGIPVLTDRAWRRFDWHASSMQAQFDHRGIGSRDVLPEHPVRDDLKLYCNAISRLAKSYVDLYYASDEDVTGDPELAAWVRSIRAPEGADVPSFGNTHGRLDTVAELVEAVASIIWRASAWHAAVNYPVYETTAYQPGYPASLFGPPPRSGRQYEEADFLGLLPPEEITRELLVDLMQVSNLRINRLGEYPAGTFSDPRVPGIVDEFKLELKSIEVQIRERNRFRVIPFPFLDPALVTASVHI